MAVSPVRIMLTVSREKAEKVVKPPSRPVARKRRRSCPAPSALSASQPTSIPMAKPPSMLTVKVAQGQVEGRWRRLRRPTPWRSAAPMAPPAATRRKWFMAGRLHGGKLRRQYGLTALARGRFPDQIPACRSAAAGGCSSMVEQQLPKLTTGVRFPSPAPLFLGPFIHSTPRFPFANRHACVKPQGSALLVPRSKQHAEASLATLLDSDNENKSHYQFSVSGRS